MTAVLAPPTQLVSIVYVSSATRPFADEEILELLRIARRNNERLGVTGMLLYRDGNFLQVLEGSVGAIDELVQIIRKDPRHQGFILMSRKNIEERNFSDWSMAFRNMSKDCAVEHGYSPFLQPDFDDTELGDESELIFRLLRRFKQAMR